MKSIFNKDIASALILAGYDNNPDGIIDHAPNYEEYYFEARDDDNVEDFKPCHFVVASFTDECNATIDINSGVVHFKNEKIENLKEFYGFFDEDESYTLGIREYKKL